jgi:hypothetical protein
MVASFYTNDWGWILYFWVASAVLIPARFAMTSDMLGLLIGLVFVVRGGCPLASTSAGLLDRS